MDIHKKLFAPQLTANRTAIVEYIGRDPKRFAVLMEAFFTDDPLLSQRAAFSFGFIAKLHPDLLYPYLERLISNLKNPVHDAIKRNTVNALQQVSIPEPLWGEAFDNCYQLLTAAQEPIAIKVFSMTVLLHIVQQVPELKDELRIAIEDQWPYGSSGFRNRGAKVLRALDKL